MSVADRAREIIRPRLWQDVARQLEGDALDWWTKHQQDLLAIGQDDAEDIAQALADGDTTGAKFAIVGNMTRAEWRAYRDGTTKKLGQIARSRATVLGALSDLGGATMEAVGKALVSALTG